MGRHDEDEAKRHRRKLEKKPKKEKKGKHKNHRKDREASKPDYAVRLLWKTAWLRAGWLADCGTIVASARGRARAPERVPIHRVRAHDAAADAGRRGSGGHRWDRQHSHPQAAQDALPSAGAHKGALKSQAVELATDFLLIHSLRRPKERSPSPDVSRTAV